MGSPGHDNRLTRTRDGRDWQIGTAADVDWLIEGTTPGLTIASGIPPLFAAYATIVLPEGDERPSHERALLAVLREYSSEQSWWLGYLDTGSDDIVFPDAPLVSLYSSWDYALVAAGPEQAATWGDSDRWKGVLPDLIFPADRSWLLSTLWDDDWSCVGGSAEFVASLVADPELGRRTRRVGLDEDATPPGHVAR